MVYYEKYTKADFEGRSARTLRILLFNANFNAGMLRTRVTGFFYTAKYFFDAVGRVLLHPRIRKKYGLSIGYVLRNA